MRDKMRAKYHKGAMKMIRAFNKNLENDELWRGRFIVMVKGERWERFPDNSGGILNLAIRMYDKKTKIYQDYRWEYAPYLHTIIWHLTMDIGNDFVVETVKVWDEDPRPTIYDNNDYRKVKVNWDKINKAPWAFEPWNIGHIE